MKEAIHHLRHSDPILAEIIQRVGDYRIEFREPGLETLVKSIVYQQLSGRVASIIFERLVKASGGALTSAAILRLRPDRMRKLGLSKQKTEYIRDLARHTRDRRIVFEVLETLSDAEVIDRLTAVKGIGVWTVHMFLMFALRRTDVQPEGELGIRNAIKDAYAKKDSPTPAEVEAMGARWRPYCTVASWYLWRSLEPNANL